MAPWLALLPLLALQSEPRANRLSYVHGLSYWIASMPWIASTVETFGGLPWYLGWASLLILAGYLALYHLAFSFIARRLLDGPAWLTLTGLPSVWVSLEWVRTWAISGYPWNLAGYALVDLQPALDVSAWIGVYGVSALVVLVNVGLFVAWRRRSVVVAVVAIGVTTALLGAASVLCCDVEPEETFRAHLLQPNTPILSDARSPLVESSYRKIFEVAHAACEQEATLLVWPESAAWPYAVERDARFRSDLFALSSRGCPVLLNSPRWDDGDVYNSAFMVSDQTVQYYDKRHLVPFGEYVPYGDLLPFVGSLARAAGSFSAGEEATLLEWESTGIGTSICFEITFPDEVADFVDAGADLLVTMTNDAWYGDSSAPHQHLRAARFRAAENARPVLRAALTGITAHISARGEILDRIGIGDEGFITATVAPNRHRTPFTRAPFATVGAALIGALSAIFWVLRRAFPKASTRPTGPRQEGRSPA